MVPGAAGLLARLSAAQELTRGGRGAQTANARHRVWFLSAARGPRINSAAWVIGHSRDAPRSGSLRYGEIKQKPGASRYESTLVLAVNSITLGGLLFLLVPLRSSADAHSNLTHGSLFMLGAYIGASLVVWYKLDFWLAAIVSALLVAAFGGLIERLLLRRLAGNSLAQVLVTLGIAFMIADACLMAFTGDPITVPTPAGLVGAVRGFGLIFPIYRLVVILIAVVIAVAPGLPIARAWAR